MRHERWIAGAIAAGICLSAAGCGIITDKQESTAALPTASKEEETPAETAKPTEPQPEEIVPFPQEPEAPAEELEGGKRIVIMTDILYMAPLLMDMGEGFQNMVEHGDGKLTNYIWEITDAAFEEIKLLTPDVLVITGDLTLQGEKESHEALAQKLDEVEKSGIEVVVMPGNHDINNPSASSYSGPIRRPAERVTPEEFEEIYQEFGYREAWSRDPYSLSYTYDLGPSMRLMMLDSCQYESGNKVGGMIKTETYEWIESQLQESLENGIYLLPAAHHNLLEESKVYTQDCTIEHSEELVQLLESYNIGLFVSGHLHLQHFMQHMDIGIWEIVTSSLSTPPCQYGVLEYMDDGSFSYYTRQVNMEKWAREQRSEDENLLNFNTYGPQTLKRIFYNQAYDAMKDSREEETGSLFVQLTEEEKQEMSQVYAELNAAYFAGKAYEVVEKAVGQPGYEMWRRYCYPAILYQYLECIVEDGVVDYNYLSQD